MPVAGTVTEVAGVVAASGGSPATRRWPVFGGMVGSALLGIGAVGVGFLPKRGWPEDTGLVEALRLHPSGVDVSVACLVVGLGALIGSWLLVGRDLRRSGPRPTGELIRIFWLWAAPLMLTPPLFSRDAWSYAAQGNLLRVGLNPYAVAPAELPGPFLHAIDPLWAHTPAPYGPLFVVLSGAVVSLTWPSVFLSALGMRLLAVAGVALLARYLPRLARACGVDPAGAVWLGLLNPLVVTHLVGGGHNDALMIGLMVAGLALAVERSPAVGAAVATLGVGVKAPAAVVVAFVGLMWAEQLSGRLARLRGLARAGVVAAVTFGALTVASGLGLGWIPALDTPGTVRTWLSAPTAAGMAGGALGAAFGLGAHTDQLITVARLAGGMSAAVITGRFLLKTASGGAARAAGLCLLLVVALGPVVQPWYLLWGGVLLAASTDTARERRLLISGSVGFAAVSLLSSTRATAWAVGPLAVAVLAAAVCSASFLRHPRAASTPCRAARPSYLGDGAAVSSVVDGGPGSSPTARPGDPDRPEQWDEYLVPPSMRGRHRLEHRSQSSTA